jgi:hypothetical protein
VIGEIVIEIQKEIDRWKREDLTPEEWMQYHHVLERWGTINGLERAQAIVESYREESEK